MRQPGRVRQNQGRGGKHGCPRGLRGWVIALGLCWPVFAVAGVGSAYVGAERCKGCHPFEYQRWAEGPHARTDKSLTKAQLADAKCNNCHTMLPGDTSERFVGVQCERCHGPGKYYNPEYVMKDKELSRAVGLVDPKPEHCTACHTEGTPSIQPFDYARMWAQIDHGPAARKRWEAARAKSGKAAAP